MSRRANKVSAKADRGDAVEGPKLLFGMVDIPEVAFDIFFGVLRVMFIGISLWNAFRIRTHAITKYGMVIHEFDPWFNFRATEYLSEHGWDAFFHWFDYMSWYPLGRPVGTTIYPGMQITAVAIHRALEAMGPAYAMSLNDVCCMIPCWFGVSASALLGLLTYECSGSKNAAALATFIMGVIPAHIMRSVGGGYDNESIAMTAMCLTFYCWVRSQRENISGVCAVFWGVLTGFAYGYMVAAWGGYVFVLNMIGLHAIFLTAKDWFNGVYTASVFYAYTPFFVIGTWIAIQIPVVGQTPLRSFEQIVPLLFLIGVTVLHMSEFTRRAAGNVPIWSPQGIRIRMRYFTGLGCVLVAIAAVLYPSGYFGPLTSRVRSLFVRHTRTGNPLVDSVSEHQPASAEAYWYFLHICYTFSQVGFFITCANVKKMRQASFLLLYAAAAFFFSTKMARLMILAGPVASALSGVMLSTLYEFAYGQLWWNDDAEERAAKAAEDATKSTKRISIGDQFKHTWTRLRTLRIALSIVILLYPIVHPQEVVTFLAHCESQAIAHSAPKIMFEAKLKDGEHAIIDDYRQAYFWLRDNTPEDSRVMAWWDYGYQITGIANRTTIADGNTWNHEHIATLGKCLTSPVKEAHDLIRHISDYVLVWAGGGGDDLGKSPHMARIGNSVYRDICPGDPICEHFGFERKSNGEVDYRRPTPTMRRSLLYHLHSHGVVENVNINPEMFQEVHTSKYGLVRIFKVMNVDEDSKAWLADPKNRVCDAPGSWYCVGQYPPVPAWQELLAKRVDFGQIEDINKKDKIDSAYYEKYMQRMRAAHGG